MGSVGLLGGGVTQLTSRYLTGLAVGAEIHVGVHAHLLLHALNESHWFDFGHKLRVRVNGLINEVDLLGAVAPRRGRRGTVAIGLGEAFAGGTAGGGVGPSAGTALDDLLATVGAEVVAVVVELAAEGVDRDDEGSDHGGKSLQTI